MTDELARSSGGFGGRVLSMLFSLLATAVLPLVVLLTLLSFWPVLLAWLAVGLVAWGVSGLCGVVVAPFLWLIRYFAVTWIAAILVCVIHDRGFARI